MADIVVAVDLGTSRSTWAYSLPSKAKEDIPLRVPRGSQSSSATSMKTETAILLEGNSGKVLAFGHNARKKYIICAEEASPSSATNMLFQWFKVNLCHNLGYTSVNDPVARAERGQKLPLLQVVAAALGHFKEDVVAYLSELLHAPLDVSRVRWVLTIPAIFDDFAKHFMRQAAYRAGMINTADSSNLVLCLEPEAACLAVNLKESPDIVEAGCKAMILDCGGGTVDITTYEVLTTSPLSLKEIIAPTGGPWGSVCVDDAFKEWLRVLLGGDNYKRIEHTSEFLSLLEQWEDGKTQFLGEEDERVRLNFAEIARLLPISDGQFQDLCCKYEDANRKPSSATGIKRFKFILSLPCQLMTTFFTSTINSIAGCLEKIKRHPDLRDLDHVFLVGGLSSSPLIQKVARDILESDRCKVLAVLRPEVAIVKGAVLFGSRPEVFRTRKARLTYGIRAMMHYDSRNPEHVKRRASPPVLAEDGKERLSAFYSHIKVGDDIPTGGVCPASTYIPLWSSQTTIQFDILASHSRDIQYPDKKECFLLGSVTVPVNRTLPYQDRGVSVQFMFGGTELLVTCTENKTGVKVGKTKVSVVQEVQQV